MIYLDSEKDADEKNSESALDIMQKKFFETRQILLTGEVNKALAEKIVRQLLVMEAASDSPIRIYIDSPGGDVDAGYAIFDMIRFVRAPVYCIGMGLVASAGALILLAADKSRRIGLPNSHYLIHQPLSGMKGVATDIEIHAQELEKMLNWGMAPRLMPRKLKLMPSRVASLMPGMASRSWAAYWGISCAAVT